MFNHFQTMKSKHDNLSSRTKGLEYSHLRNNKLSTCPAMKTNEEANHEVAISKTIESFLKAAQGVKKERLILKGPHSTWYFRCQLIGSLVLYIYIYKKDDSK